MQFVERCELFRIGPPIIDSQRQELFALAKGKVESLLEVEKFIRGWLVLHILIEDKKYSEQLFQH